jgi:PAS domain S-box-containing protein
MNQQIDQPSLEQIIDRAPLTVKPEATVLSAITLMSQPDSSQDTPAAIEMTVTTKYSSRDSYSYVLVLEESKLIGILTEHDVVRLTVSGINLADVQVLEVMTQPIITLCPAADQGVLSVLSFLRQHHISHLPIVDEQGLLLGMVTERDLLQLFDPLLTTANYPISPAAQQITEIDLQQHELLLQSQKDLTDFVENAIFGLHWVAADGTIIWANQAELDLLGYTRDEYIGHSITEFHADQEIIADILQRLLSDQVVQDYEADLRCKDGSIRRVLIDSNSSWSNGEFIRTRCFTRDITDRRQAELELQNQKQDLARSNAELQQFAYVASHDLQEPLRMITSYLELLERRYKGQLDERADKFIAYAVDGATRMQTLINDLLSYSRVGTGEQNRKAVDCEKIVQNVLSNLHLSIVQSHAAITHDSLPKVNGDPSQLTQLFQNLISNAIKFHREEEAPQIHIGVDGTNGKWLFSVQDNGIGMEAQYLERIFIIFQRLHSKTEYPGTGIGLAVCKKIVERHGGNLRVESQPDHGSTFYFTLPQTAGKS